MRLIKTSFDFSSEAIKKDDVFLGRWCCKELNDLNNGNIISNYHWDNRSKFYQDYLYLDILYEQVLDEYVHILNKIHNLNNNKRYWRIVFGPWLRFFIDISFDRYEIIKSIAGKGQNVNIYKYDSTQWAPKSFLDFSNLINNERWNEVIFSECIKYLNISHSIKNHINILPEDAQINKKRNFNFYLKKIFSFYESCIPNSLNKVVIISAYMNLLDLAKLQISIGQLPYLNGPMIEISDSKINHVLRESIRSEPYLENFQHFIRSLIPLHIPKVYLENFLEFKSAVLAAYPKNPKTIFTSNAYQTDDAFKIWAAENTTNGKKLIIGQHGGNMGNALFNQTEDHQIKIADKYASWGWQSNSQPWVEPLPSLKLSNQNIKYKKNDRVAMILTSYPKYFYCHYSIPVADQFFLYLDNQVSFLNNLNSSIIKRLLIKPDPSFKDNSWDANVYISNKGFSENFIKTNKNMYDLLEESNLCICTNNTTTFLETLASNYPTIIFWDNALFEIREDAVNEIRLLEDAGILFYCPLKAANKVNDISKNIDKWWKEPALQKAVREFTDRYALKSSSWVSEWKSFLIRDTSKK